MNTHDIELPPLPKASKMYDIPGYDEEELKDYARAAIEPYAKRIAQLEAARFAYASEFPPNEDGDPDVGSIHENIRKLKAELEAARQHRGEQRIEWLREVRECAEHVATSDYYGIDAAISKLMSVVERWPQPAEPSDSLPRHAAQTLATAIYETAQKMGIANGDHSTLSVPQCLHLLDCMSQPAEPSKNGPRKGDQRIIDGVVWTCTDPEIDRWVTTGSQPAAPVKVNAIFETQDGEVIGTTDAKVKRVEWQDDGSLTVVIDYWPQPAESIVSDVEAIARLLERREWADHIATTPLGQRLETAVTALVGTDQQPAEPEQKPSVEALAEMANGWSSDRKELASKVLERRQTLKHQGYQPIQSGPLPPPPAPQPAEPVGEVLGETCIDGGKCHHGCKERCFRRQCCDPFSDYSGPWEYADETIYPQPAEPVKTLIDNQEPLEEEFQRVLDEHSWDLYVKANEPVKVPSSFPTGTEYSVEPHGNGYAIYQGRDQFHHGLNLAHLTECTPEFSKRIESALNAMSGVVKSHLKVSYDDKGDCLYVVCDSNEPADAEEDDMGILYRRAISDGRLVGITIMNLMGRHAELSDDAPQPAEPVAWTTPDEREPISASLKESRLDLYGKHYTVPLYTTPQPTEPDMGEPVAWKWRRTPATKWECVGHWDSIEAKAAAEMESQGWEVVRLYDSPQPPEPRK